GGDAVERFTGHSAEIYCVRFSPDGKTLVSAGWDKTIRLWDLHGRKHRATLEGHTEFVRDLAFTADGKTLVSSGKDGVIRMWRGDAARRARMLEGHDGLVRALSLSPDDKILASAGRDGTLNLWDFPAGKVLASLKEGVLGFQVVASRPTGERWRPAA